MIRHYTGSNWGGIWAQAKRGRVYVVMWTRSKHRICLTKRQANHAIKAWKFWYRRQGWTVRSNLAYPPGQDLPQAEAAIVLHEYDAETRRRIEGVQGVSGARVREEVSV